MVSKYSLSNIWCITPDTIIKNTSVQVNESKIAGIGGKAETVYKSPERNYLYPALINIHDHFRGNYLPRVGPPEGTYYLNWAPWDADLKSSDIYAERANISVEDCYSLSAYKNVFSGVVTSNDHFPHELNDDILPTLPMRAITDYTLAHECSSYDLKWGDGIEIEHKRAVDGNIPFITHLEEGFDEESQQGIEILEKLNCLDEHCVLIHCIGFSDADIRKANDAGAHIAWCPASNIFMFNVTCKIRKMIEAGLNISIGTDSTHTGSVNLLQEMRYAREVYHSMYGEPLPAKKVVEMVTVNPAKAFRMDDVTGSVEKGKLADLLLLQPACSDPYEALLQAEPKDIALLLQEGKPLVGDPMYKELFQSSGIEYNEIVLQGKPKLAKGDPEGLLKRVRENIGFEKELDYIPIDVQNV